MPASEENRFEDLFVEDQYLALKNHLYNYRLRKHAIESLLAGEDYTLILETGSGISPVMTRTDRIVYSEISFTACRKLKRIQGRGHYVVADATRLPFRDGAFSHTISSEVLEHIEHDLEAIAELSRVLGPAGRLIVTFPHRKAYYAADDRFIGHYRRYEHAEMVENLERAGLVPRFTRKLLGPLEKLGMLTAVWCYTLMQGLRRKPEADTPRGNGGPPPGVAALFDYANRLAACVAWLDARVWPQRFATVLLILAEKRTSERQ